MGHDIDRDLIKERYELASYRVSQLALEAAVQNPFDKYFRSVADFLCMVAAEGVRDRHDMTTEGLQMMNRRLYDDVMRDNYTHSFANPVFAVSVLGEGYGQILSAIYAELRGMIQLTFENRLWDRTILLELFLEVYQSFVDEELPSTEELRHIFADYCMDYCMDFVQNRIHEQLDTDCSFARDLIMKCDLSDERYLYAFGEYISENEKKTMRLLAGMPQEQIDAMARTYTEGYRLGFINGRKDITIKRTVNIRYTLGFERVVRAAVEQFRKMGLESIIYRHAVHLVDKRGQAVIGYTGGDPNPQYAYDHRQDDAIFLTDAFVSEKLRCIQQAYEKYDKAAAVHGGPAVMETFGEQLFRPVDAKEVIRYKKSQQSMRAAYDTQAAQIVNRYMKGEERSFTIIAYPVAEIGDDYEEIFRETVRLNNLDYQMYQSIQQTMINALDQGSYVHVQGQGANETDLRITLHTIQDRRKQTNFENCIADVNIPVGEVFTSPVLAGTTGLLHVTGVYLNGLFYENLKLWFKDGWIRDYTCTNYKDKEENKRYIRDNILFQRDSLPMGEFAIGTNTTAYMMARRYGIEAKMPILIAEKTGPHFAVGDTCYSFEEDRAVYNPDGKEIIARENEASALRSTEPEKAYFGCHTDITIPYDELSWIRVCDGNGERTAIIENGRFVLPGTEELNRALEEETK